MRKRTPCCKKVYVSSTDSRSIKVWISENLALPALSTQPNKALLCVHDPQLKYVTSVKKVNVACFNSFPMKCSSTIVTVSATALHARLLPAIRHSGTKTHATAMQTGFLHSQTKWDYFLPLRLFQVSIHVMSQPCSSAYCTSVHPGEKNHNIIRTRVSRLVSPTGLRACTLFPLFILPCEHVFVKEKWIVCWAVV